MLTEAQKNLAKELGQLTGATLNAIPGKTPEDIKEFIQILSTEAASHTSDLPPAKDISENAVDVLEAIAENLPATEDPKKARAQKRFKNAIKVIKGLLHLFGLD